MLLTTMGKYPEDIEILEKCETGLLSTTILISVFRYKDFKNLHAMKYAALVYICPI